MLYSLEILSPQKPLARETDVKELIVPALWGQMDILPQHTLYTTQLTAGTVTYKTKDNKTNSLAIDSGLLVINGTSIKLMVYA